MHTDISVVDGSPRIRQILIGVFPEYYYVERARVSVVVERERTLKQRFLDYVTKRVTYAVIVSWGYAKNVGKISDEYEGSYTEWIHKTFYAGKYEALLNAGIGDTAVIGFAVQDDDEAYLTNDRLQALPIGHNYTLQVAVVGLKLPKTRPRRFRLELRGWNDFDFWEYTYWNRFLHYLAHRLFKHELANPVVAT